MAGSKRGADMAIVTSAAPSNTVAVRLHEIICKPL